MEFDYLKTKEYSYHQEKDLDNRIYYILSFNNSLHIRVTDQAKNLIDKFDGKHTLKDIVNELNNQEYAIEENELIVYIKNVLMKNYLIEGYEEDKKELKKRNHTRISVHIPIVESKRFNFVYKILNLLFNKYVSALLILLVSLIFGSILYDAFVNGGINLEISTFNSGFIIILVYMSLLLHEFGHITAAYRYGVTAGKIGVGIYIIYPVFYVDLTNAWRIDNRKRVIIDLGGVYLQIVTCIPLYLMYYFFNNDTYLVSAILVATMTFVNLIPILKLDGYWFLSDSLRLSNISVEPLKSIKTLIFKCIHKNEKCTNSEKIKGIYSLVYVVSTVVILTYGVTFGISIFRDYVSIINQLKDFIYYLIHGEILTAFTILNKIFVVVVPVIFILYAVSNSIFLNGFKLFKKIKDSEGRM